VSESPSIADFRQAAEQFCELAEHGGTLPVARLLMLAERALVALYGAALSLPRGG